MNFFESKTFEALRFMFGIFNKYNIPYQISGGFAAKMYGSTRPLNDIDFDISERNFQLIIPEISRYITFGPKRYADGKWDCELITLNYHGQEIDICGADTTKISNKERTGWISLENKLSEAFDMKVDGMEIKIINPNELVNYKKELDGEHQLTDILAVENYIRRA